MSQQEDFEGKIKAHLAASTKTLDERRLLFSQRERMLGPGWTRGTHIQVFDEV
jgi:hypothetical protein